jgi:hypothetical protein
LVQERVVVGRFRKGAPIFLEFAMRRQTKVHTFPVRESSRKDKNSRATKSRKELINTLLSRIEKQLDSETTKVTLADFIRLIQLQRELEQEEQPAEVIVTWRDRLEKQNAGK